VSWNPKQNWAHLRRRGISEAGLLGTLSCVTDINTGYGKARFALGSNQEPRLLIPCSDNDLSLDLDLTGNITVGFASYDLEGRRQRFVDLVCHERKLEAVFGELADVLLARLENGSGPSEAVEKTITDFRELLIATAASAVDNSKLIGLLGELIVMQRLTCISPVCVESWLGPWEQRHDFRRMTKAIEVKTSSRSDATEVHINGIDQLRPPNQGELILTHVCLELSAGGSGFLSSIFDQLVESGVDRMRLIEGLAEVGCLDPHDDAWNQRRYEIQSVTAWRVGAGFPRLTGAELRPEMNLSGISDLKYVVDLSQADDYRMTEGDFDSYLNAFMA
jgi:hypothetical protein